MKKIVLVCTLCVAAFGFFKSCSEYETYEEREKCRKETGKMIGEGAVALSNIVSNLPTYISSANMACAGGMLLSAEKTTTSFVCKGQFKDKKQALKMLNDGCYNVDNLITREKAEIFYTAQFMMKRNNASDMLNLALLADPKTRKDVKMIEVSDKQINDDKRAVILSSCAYLATYKKDNAIVDDGIKKACNLYPEKNSAECAADMKKRLNMELIYLNKTTGTIIPLDIVDPIESCKNGDRAGGCRILENEAQKIMENNDDKNYEKAYEYAKTACEYSIGEDVCTLKSDMLYEGKGVAKSVISAKLELLKLCQRGFESVCTRLERMGMKEEELQVGNIANEGAEYAMKYTKGDESAYAPAYEKLKYACDYGEALPCYYLYGLIQAKINNTKDKSMWGEASAVLERACKWNHKKACDTIKKFKDAEIWDK